MSSQRLGAGLKVAISVSFANMTLLSVISKTCTTRFCAAFCRTTCKCRAVRMAVATTHIIAIQSMIPTLHKKRIIAPIWLKITSRHAKAGRVMLGGGNRCSVSEITAKPLCLGYWCFGVTAGVKVGACVACKMGVEDMTGREWLYNGCEEPTNPRSLATLMSHGAQPLRCSRIAK